MKYRGFRVKFKLYAPDDGEPEASDEDKKFWREDGKLSFLEMMAEDPESSVEKLEDGVFWQPKM